MKKYFSPGRVNLIGEHIDYNGGNVFPIAINIGTYGDVKLRDDHIIRLFSKNFVEDGYIELDLNKTLIKQNNWSDYVAGVITILKKHGYLLKQGFDLEVFGNIPNSSGLSSSASLEVLIIYILNELNNLNITRKDMAVYSMEAENDFVGVNCGIMDQFIIANGVKNKALKLDCSTLDYELVNCDFKEYQLLVLNSKVKRGLVDSFYNQRRSECEQGLEIAKKYYDINNLCELNLNKFNTFKDELEENVYKRVKHAISEQDRVNKSVDALNNNDLILFGKLMNESHQSLKDDFMVSCLELDYLVDKALEYNAIGARMTGAGFGGCAICLISKNDVQSFKKMMIDSYQKDMNLTLEIYEVTIENGVDSHE